MNNQIEILVEHIGKVYSGKDRDKAADIFNRYTREGRITKNSVAMLIDDEVVCEFQPLNKNSMRFAR